MGVFRDFRYILPLCICWRSCTPIKIIGSGRNSGRIGACTCIHIVFPNKGFVFTPYPRLLGNAISWVCFNIAFTIKVRPVIIPSGQACI